MRKRLLLLTLALVIAMTVPAGAANASAFQDIHGHWAESYIGAAVSDGLFNGISETQFAPSMTMTRGMFLTALGRFAGVNTAAWTDASVTQIFRDVSGNAWYAPYVNWAVRNGIVNGTGTGTFSPNAPVTREQIATIVTRFSAVCGYRLNPVEGTVISASFSDSGAISSWATAEVEALRATGILQGKPDGAGGYAFAPKATATRAECAAVFCRLKAAAVLDENRVVIPVTGVDIPELRYVVPVRTTLQLQATITPANATNQTIVWASNDPDVATVSQTGLVTMHNYGSALIFCYTSAGAYDTCQVTSGDNGEILSEAGKLQEVFGTTDIGDPRTVYTSAAEAAAHMTTISVQVWDFADSSRATKTTRTMKLVVNAAIADRVSKVFAEIYAGPEQFPIHDLGGYRWESRSEHTSGLAIDVNANENYFCNASGGALSGSYWRPGQDPYSIPLDGDVALAFAHYGFQRGIYWNSGNKDYMHFSYFGT